MPNSRSRQVDRLLGVPLAFLLISALLVGCTGETVDTLSPTTAFASTSTAPSTTAASTTTTTPPTTTTTTTAPSTTTTVELGTLDQPLPVGDPLLSGFTYSEMGTEWEGFVGGIVEAGPGRFNDDPGRCLVVVGTITPTAIDDGTVTNSFGTPTFSMIVDGRLLDDEVNECDTNDVEAAGYSWILDAEVTVGTTFPFYAEFFIPGDSPSEPEALVLGSASGNNALYYTPSISTEIPAPGDSTAGATDQELLPVGDPSLSGFTYTEIGTEWEGFVGGIVEAGPGRFNDDPGRCLLVVGTITPTAIDDGTVTNIFSTPTFSMIVDGRLLDDEVNECDTDDVEAAGYSWILDAEVTVGTAFPFYAEFFIPGDLPSEPEALVLGSASGDNALYYKPTISDSIPTP